MIQISRSLAYLSFNTRDYLFRSCPDPAIQANTSESKNSTSHSVTCATLSVAHGSDLPSTRHTRGLFLSPLPPPHLGSILTTNALCSSTLYSCTRLVLIWPGTGSRCLDIAWERISKPSQVMGKRASKRKEAIIIEHCTKRRTPTPNTDIQFRYLVSVRSASPFPSPHPPPISLNQTQRMLSQ